MTEKAQIGASLADSGFSTYLNIVDVQKIYWYHDLFSGRKKWNAGWRKYSDTVCFRSDRGYSCGYDQPACGRGNGSSVISVQLSYHEKEGIIIFSD